MIFSKKRILVDIKNIKNNNDLEQCGIYVKFNENNIYNAQALIIGPRDTPYEKGFYFFDINFPDDYPMEPPKVKFCTLDPKIRFNPNLYTCGKVCLSIINTWNGPGWTSCLTLKTVLLSIQSLLNEIPIRNEPGFEKEQIDGDTCVRYNRIIEYYNLKVAVLKMIENPSHLFESFSDIMAKYFMDNIDFYEKYIATNMKHNNKVFSTNIYSLNEKFNFQMLTLKIDKLKLKYASLLEPASTLVKASASTLIPDPVSTLVKASASTLVKASASTLVPDPASTLVLAPVQKKKPDIKANEYDEGYKMVSEHDGNEYIVKLIKPKKIDSQLSKSYKRWFLHKKNINN